MNPAGLIPVADAIPVSWVWFEALSLVTFTAHLLFMNAVLGGAIIALTAHLGRDEAGPARELSGRLPTILALTVNLGVPPLLFLQVLHGQFLYTSAVLMAVWWLALVGLVMVGYGLLYGHGLGFERLGSRRALILGLAVTLLLAASFILSNVMTMMLRPEAWLAYFDNPHGTLLNLSDPALAPRWLHFIVASMAVGGLFVALANRGRARRGEQGAAERVALGLRWFTRASLAQVVVGLWFLLSLPDNVMLLFLGRGAPHTALLAAGLLAAGVALHHGFKGRPGRTAAWAVATVASMVGVREMVKFAYLKPYFSPESLAVTGQYTPLVFFLACFAAGLLAVAWMLRLWLRAGKGAEAGNPDEDGLRSLKEREA